MNRVNIYEKDQNDNWILIKSSEVEFPSTEQLIAEKEAKLLEIYDELQALKQK